VTFLHRDSLATAHGAVAVGFTEPLPILTDVREARATVLADLAAATGGTPFVMHQVHGADLHVVAADDLPDEPVLEVDALVSTRDDVALMARAADCVPMLLASPEGAVAAVHAGRRGMALGVVGTAIQRLRSLGASDLTAWVGPHICGRCYEVPAALQDEVAAIVPESRATTSWGTPALDLGAGVRAQLEAAGVTDVRVVDACTREDARWPSYRRDGDAALRFAGVVWRES
jgi:YfiH family protein